MFGANFSPEEGLAGGSSLGGWIASLFGHDPFSAAGKYFDQIPGVYNKAFSPYMHEGEQDLPYLHSQYQQMLEDPSGFLAKIGAGYKASPGYQYKVNEATRAANQAAAAGGMLGSPAEQASLASRVNGIASQDYNDYLDRALGVNKTGLGGVQGLENQGFGATQDYARSLADYLQSRASMAGAQTGYQNQQLQNAGGMLGGLAGIFGSFL
jgi:hypothetical protein